MIHSHLQIRGWSQNGLQCSTFFQRCLRKKRMLIDGGLKICRMHEQQQEMYQPSQQYLAPSAGPNIAFLSAIVLVCVIFFTKWLSFPSVQKIESPSQMQSSHSVIRKVSMAPVAFSRDCTSAINNAAKTAIWNPFMTILFPSLSSQILIS